jgi:hypothetical protein
MYPTVGLAAVRYTERRKGNTMGMSNRRKTDKITTIAVAPRESLTSREPVTDEDVARRAYELYRDRGWGHGHDVDDWLQAERELRPSVRSTAA